MHHKLIWSEAVHRNAATYKSEHGSDHDLAQQTATAKRILSKPDMRQPSWRVATAALFHGAAPSKDFAQDTYLSWRMTLTFGTVIHNHLLQANSESAFNSKSSEANVNGTPFGATMPTSSAMTTSAPCKRAHRSAMKFKCGVHSKLHPAIDGQQSHELEGGGAQSHYQASLGTLTPDTKCHLRPETQSCHKTSGKMLGWQASISRGRPSCFARHSGWKPGKQNHPHEE